MWVDGVGIVGSIAIPMVFGVNRDRSLVGSSQELELLSSQALLDSQSSLVATGWK